MTHLNVRIRRMRSFAGAWCINYSVDGVRWGRNHYGSLSECLRCWVLVKLGRDPLRHMRPYGEHL